MQQALQKKRLLLRLFPSQSSKIENTAKLTKIENTAKLTKLKTERESKDADRLGWFENRSHSDWFLEEQRT